MKRLMGIVLMIMFLGWMAGPVFAADVSTTISGAPPSAGTWTSAISSTHQNPSGFLNISVYGAAWAGTVYLQRTFDSGTTWYDVTTFTKNAQKALVDQEAGVRYRIGMKSGGYTSGSVAVRLSH